MKTCSTLGNSSVLEILSFEAFLGTLCSTTEQSKLTCLWCCQTRFHCLHGSLPDTHSAQNVIGMILLETCAKTGFPTPNHIVYVYYPTKGDDQCNSPLTYRCVLIIFCLVTHFPISIRNAYGRKSLKKYMLAQSKG